jgi:hypothetical protein
MVSKSKVPVVGFLFDYVEEFPYWPWPKQVFSIIALIALFILIGGGTITLIIWLFNPQLITGFTTQSEPEDENKNKIL